MRKVGPEHRLQIIKVLKEHTAGLCAGSTASATKIEVHQSNERPTTKRGYFFQLRVNKR
jgi:hypothetical protein